MADKAPCYQCGKGEFAEMHSGRFGHQYVPTTPRADIATLEGALRELLNEIPGCACDEAYTTRDLLDPTCTYHEITGYPTDNVITKARALVPATKEGKDAD